MSHSAKSERTIFRTRRSVVLALTNIVAYSGLTLMVACGESPTGVPAAPQPTSAALAPSGPSRAVGTTSGSQLILATGLKRTVPLATSITRSITLYQTGGTVQIPEAGLNVNIPRTAIGNDPITITVTALAGDLVAYEFGPSGTKFTDGVHVVQDLTYTSWYGNTGKLTLGAGYFADPRDIDPNAGTAEVRETLPVVVTGNRIKFDVFHFSGYMVSTGRAAY